MRILLINNFYYPNALGGAEISVQTLAEKLVEKDHEVFVICLSGDKDTRRFQHNGVQIVALGRHRRGASPTSKHRPKLRRLQWHLSAALDRSLTEELEGEIAKISPDIVNSFNLAGLTSRIWSAVKQQNLSLVHTLFGTYLMCFRGPMFRKGQDCGTACSDCKLLTKKRKLDSGLVDVVVGDSQAVLRRHIDGNYFLNARIQSVINCGFDTDSIAPPQRENSKGPLRIGFLGRLHPTKGLHVLLEACNSLPADMKWVLKIAGGGTAEQEEKIKETSRGKIQFLGWQQADKFLSEIDVLVAPSIWNDPLPRVVFESFCAGVPVIGSNIGGIPEMIKEGQNGHLFPPGDAKSLAKVLSKYSLAQEDTLNMRNSCLESARHFTSERFADDYINLYKAVLSEKASTASLCAETEV